MKSTGSYVWGLVTFLVIVYSFLIPFITPSTVLFRDSSAVNESYFTDLPGDDLPPVIEDFLQGGEDESPPAPSAPPETDSPPPAAEQPTPDVTQAQPSPVPDTPQETQPDTPIETPVETPTTEQVPSITPPDTPEAPPSDTPGEVPATPEEPSPTVTNITPSAVPTPTEPDITAPPTPEEQPMMQGFQPLGGMGLLGAGGDSVTANFSADITTGPAPLTVQFTDTSDCQDPTEWYWEFGDGNTSTVQNPSWTYTTPGTYSVNFLVTNASGSDWENKTDLILVTEPSQLARITGTVYRDQNHNTIRDEGELNLTDWFVYLDTDGDNTHEEGEPHTWTDSEGFFQFDVDAGTYTVREIIEEGFGQTAPLGSWEYTITAQPGETYHDNDFGNYEYSPEESEVYTCRAIDSPGTYTLQNDIPTSDQKVCIDITSRGVTFDGNDYLISGIFDVDEWPIHETGEPDLVIEDPLIALALMEVMGSDEPVPIEVRPPYGILVHDLSPNPAEGTVIVKNVQLRGWEAGIFYRNSPFDPMDGGIIQTTTLDASLVGILVDSSSSITILENAIGEAYPSFAGIALYSSTDTTVEGNTVIGGLAGIGQYQSSSTLIDGNSLSQNGMGGIGLSASTDSTISNNAISGSAFGISVVSSDENRVSSNILTDNTFGLLVESSTDNELSSNTANNNQFGGILVDSYGEYLSMLMGIDLTGFFTSPSSLNTISRNRFFESGNGLVLYSSPSNEIRENEIYSNDLGLMLFSSTSNEIHENEIYANRIGIGIENTSGNIFTRNMVYLNIESGIAISSSSDNALFDNSFSNDINVVFDDQSTSENTWNTDLQFAPEGQTNIIGGSYLGGNFWGTPSHDGWSETQPDTDPEDGICDTPYVLLEANTDYYPLSGVTSFSLSVHNLNTELDYVTIQDAIDAPETQNGDIIEVDPGTYNENVDVYKSITLRSSSGNPDDTLIQAANANDHVIAVTANAVHISGFTLTGTTETGGVVGGICILNANDCVIEKNRAMATDEGLCVLTGSNNVFSNNTAESSHHNGIFLWDAYNTTVFNNTAASNGHTGIILYSNNSYCTVAHNDVTGNGAGIGLGESTDNDIVDNTVISNNGGGIGIGASRNNTVAQNIVSSNGGNGISLYSSSTDNDLLRNTVSSNAGSGIHLSSDCVNNLIYDNYFDSVYNAHDEGSNRWNITPVPGTNILGGSWIGGNYWNDYSGVDVDDDGLGDTNLPYTNSGEIGTGGDWHPLTISSLEPVVVFHLDEGSGVVAGDASGNGNDGAITGATWATGISGNALSFDGSGDWAESQLNTPITGDLTVEFWMKNTVTTSYQQRIVDLGQSNDIGLQLCMFTDGRLLIDNSGGPSPSLAEMTAGAFNDGEWHHVAGVRRGNEYELYVDGEFATATTGSIPAYSRLFLGKRAARSNDYYNGLIDEVAVYSRALTSDEILTHYHSYHPDAILMLHFNEGSGDIAYDSSGYGNNGSLYGPMWVDGISGTALYFNGVDNYVDIPTVDALRTNAAKSVFAWINVPDGLSGEGWGVLRSVVDDSPAGHWRMIGFTIEGDIYRPAVYYIDRQVHPSAAPISHNEWHYIGFTWSPNQPIRLYVDGALSAESATIASWDTVDGHAYIGRQYMNPALHYFNGTIDEVAIYPRVLSPGEILDEYLAKTATSAPTANFSADITSGSPPLSVQFTDTSDCVDPTGWYWEFGDGNTSTVQNPSWIYTAPGTYSVNFLVTNTSGSDWENKSALINVAGPVLPQARVQISRDIDVRTEGDSLPSATYEGTIVHRLQIYNEDDASDTVLGNISMAMKAAGITGVGWDRYADWNATDAEWNFPPEYVINEGGVAFGADVRTSQTETLALDLSVSRDIDQIDFSEPGIQTVNVTFSFEDTDFQWAWGHFVTNERPNVLATMVPGSFATNAPVTWVGEGEHWIHADLDGDALTIGTPYYMTFQVQVEPLMYPVIYKPYTAIGRGLYHTETDGGTGMGTVITSPAILPPGVTSASVATDVENVWIQHRNDHLIAELDEVVSTVGPIAHFAVAYNTVVSTDGDEIRSGIQDSTLYLAGTVINEDDSSDTVLRNVTISLESDSISSVIPEEYAEWDGTSVTWMYPPSVTVPEGDSLRGNIVTPYQSTAYLPVTVNRTLNRTMFTGSGYQELYGTVIFEEKEFIHAWVHIYTAHSPDVVASIVPGSFTSDAPLNDYTMKDGSVHLGFNTDDIEVGVPYHFSVLINVEAGETSVLFKPRVVVGILNDEVEESGSSGTSVTIPPYLLPAHLLGASAAVEDTNFWLLDSDEETIGLLEGVATVSPAADFSADITYGEGPLTVTFTDLSSGSPIGWSWDFGDGGSSTASDPVHIYDDEGTYTVSLTVTNAASDDTATREGYITVISADRSGLVFADNFNDNELDTARWTVDVAGEGNGFQEQNQRAEFSVFGYQAYSAGHAVLHSTPVDATGWEAITFSGTWWINSDTAELMMHLSDTEDPGRWIGVRYATWTEDLAFYAGPDSPSNLDRTPPFLPVNFTIRLLRDGYEYYEEGTLVSKVDSSVLPHADILNQSETFEILIGGWDYSSLSSTMQFDGITVSVESMAAPVASFTASPLSGPAPLTVQFNDTSTGDHITSWNWSFGDGLDSTEKNPVHIYSASGTYTVSLAVTNPGGSDTSEQFNYITVTEGNEPPAFDPVSPQTIAEGELLTFPVNATDAEGDELGFSADTLPPGATFDYNSPNSYTFSWIPDYSQAGSYWANFTVTDYTGSGLSDTLNVPITATNTNRPPTLDLIGSQFTEEGGLLEFSVSGSDPDDEELTFDALNRPEGSQFFEEDLFFSWSPDYDQAGTYYVNFTVTDNGGLEDYEIVEITVSNTNRGPTADDDTVFTPLNTQIAISILDNDSDPDGDELGIDGVDTPSHGTAEIQGSTILYTPETDYSGSDSFLYTVTDGTLTDTATVFVTVGSAPPLDPVRNVNTGLGYGTIQAAIDASETQNGHTIIVDSGTYNERLTISKSLTLLGNDTGSGRPVLRAGGSTAVTLSADGITFNGFIVEDTGTGINVLSDYNTISNNSLSPRVNVGVYGIQIIGNSYNNVVNNTVNGYNPASGTGYAFFLSGGSTYNTIEGNTANDNKRGVLAYASSNNNIIANNSFARNVWDGICIWNSINNEVRGNTLNSNNVGLKFWYDTSGSNSVYQNNLINNTINADTGDSINTWQSPSPVIYSYQGSVYTNYTGNYWSSYSGPDNDGDGIGDAPHTFPNVGVDQYPLMGPWEDDQILPSNRPFADFSTNTTSGPVPLTVQFSDESFCVNPLSWYWEFGDGSNSTDQNPIYTYPSTGTFTVNFRIANASGVDWENRTEFITVVPAGANQAPVLNPIGSRFTEEGEPLEFSVSGYDPDQDPITFAAEDLPKGADFFASDRWFSWTPDFDQAGTYYVNFTVTDNGGLQDYEIVEITVSDTNSAPIAVDDTAFTSEGTPITIPVLDNDSDPDGDDLSLQSVTQPANGTATITGSSILYTPDTGFSGSDTFSYTISDGFLTDTATVTVSVNGVNDPPVAVDDSASTTEDTPVVINVLNNDSDLDGDTLIVTSVTQPTNGTATITGSNVTYTPGLNFAGSDSFTYTVSDGQEGATASVTVLITPVNDPPELQSIGARIVEVGSLVEFTITATDPDGDQISYAVTGLPEGATFVNQLFTWTPKTSQKGSHYVNFSVTDPDGLEDYENVTIAVRETGSDTGGGGGGGSSEGGGGVPGSSGEVIEGESEQPDGSKPSGDEKEGGEPVAQGTTSLITEFVVLTTTDDGTRNILIDRAEADAEGYRVVIDDKPEQKTTTIILQRGDYEITIVTTGYGEEGSQITGTVISIDVKGVPVTAVLGIGTVEASFEASLVSIPEGAAITTSIYEKPTEAQKVQFGIAASDAGLEIIDIAYLVEFTKTNIDRTGPAFVNMSVPVSWVNEKAGGDPTSVYILRIADNGEVSTLATTLIGTNSMGNMVFQAYSPEGLSIFGMATAKIKAAAQPSEASVTPTPMPRTALTIVGGMVGWLLMNPIILAIVIILVALIVVFSIRGYARKKEQPLFIGRREGGAGGWEPLIEDEQQRAYASIIEVLNEVDAQIRELHDTLSKPGIILARAEADPIVERFFYRCQVAEERIKTAAAKGQITKEQVEQLNGQLGSAVDRMALLSRQSPVLTELIQERLRSI